MVDDQLGDEGLLFDQAELGDDHVVLPPRIDLTAVLEPVDVLGDLTASGGVTGEVDGVALLHVFLAFHRNGWGGGRG